MKSIIESRKDTPLILKVDTEGSEYKIFTDIFENYNDMFKNVIYICGETHKTKDFDHINGFKYIMSKLPAFSIVKEDINNEECVNNFILLNKNTEL